MSERTQDHGTRKSVFETYDLEDVLFGGLESLEKAPPYGPNLGVSLCGCGGNRVPLAEAAYDPEILRAIVPGTDLRNLRSVAEWLKEPQLPLFLKSRLHDKARADALVMGLTCTTGFVIMGVVLCAGHLPPIVGTLGIMSAMGAAARVFARTKRIASQEDLILSDLFGVRVDTYRHRSNVYSALTLCNRCLEVSHPNGMNQVKWFNLLKMYDCHWDRNGDGGNSQRIGARSESGTSAGIKSVLSQIQRRLAA